MDLSSTTSFSQCKILVVSVASLALKVDLFIGVNSIKILSPNRFYLGSLSHTFSIGEISGQV